jgi:hypothetical protein
MSGQQQQQQQQQQHHGYHQQLAGARATNALHAAA